ncbi:MAG: 2-methylisocitrate lyase-like PEP mutase family enzyme [Granulosicoccus sp.]|jgi:2-methylisocitrate lyase-like PEP mutase family enzyme
MSSALRAHLHKPELTVAPGVFELISATLADQHDFPTLYMSGNGTVASALGLPDVGLATYTEMLNRIEAITSRISTPLIADGDTGYGGLLNVDRTVRGYERAGAAGIQIEDQQAPKKCGFAAITEVIPLPAMVDKIKVALDARVSEDFMIVARTDARRGYGLNEALDRALAFEDAGADIIFIEAPESTEEMEIICKQVQKPKLLNMVDGRSTPVLPKAQIEDLGYNIAIFPCTGFLAATEAMRRSYATIAEEGSSLNVEAQLCPFDEFVQIMGFDRAREFDERWKDKSKY